MLYYASRPQPESNLSVKYERDGSLTGLLFFRASNSVYDRVSAVSHCFCINGARAGSNRFLVDFLPSKRASHVKGSTGAPERVR